MKRSNYWRKLLTLSLVVCWALVTPCLLGQPVTGEGEMVTTATFGAEFPEQTDQLRFNFRGVPLQTVLDYLSRAGGFVVVETVDVPGRVNMVSQQPLSGDEAVDLLDTVLKEQGFAAIRSGRTLTIVKRDKARMSDIPVRRGNDPGDIDRSDQMVTQIIPVRYVSVKELVENLRELLPPDATISANEKSNAVILTDSQTNVRRIVEIIDALDQSISEITTLRVFRLQHADAKDTATMIEDLFKQPTQSSNTNQRRFFPPFMGRGRDDEANNDQSDQSVALKAASTVNAAADERTNSVVVSAPEEFMPAIEKLVQDIDQSADVMTEVRVFPLQYADAEQMAEVITNVFGDKQATSNQGTTPRQRFFGPGGFFGRGRDSSNNSTNNSDLSSRERAAATVLAVADTRTNSVVVSAIAETMEQIAQVVDQLDRNPAKTKRVYVYSVQNADPEEIAGKLEEMFSGDNSTNNRNTRNTNTRTNTNARQSNSTNRSSSGRSTSSR